MVARTSAARACALLLASTLPQSLVVDGMNNDYDMPQLGSLRCRDEQISRELRRLFMVEIEEISVLKTERISAMLRRSFRFGPHHVFIVPAVDERYYVAIIAVAKQHAAFHTLAKENVAGFRNKLFPWSPVARRIQMPAFCGDGHCAFRSQPICAEITREFAGISLARSRVFVIAKYL